MATISDLIVNANYGHKGRPGQRGGSLPRSGIPGLTIEKMEKSSGRGDDHDRIPRQEHLTDDEISHRLHTAKRSSNPELQVRAKSAEALLKSEDHEIRQIARRRIAALPKMSPNEIREHQERQLNPFHAAPPIEEGESFTGHALRAFTYAIESLDKPGRVVRGALAGRAREVGNIIPFSDYLGITKEEQQVSGRDLLEKYKLVGPNVKGFDWGDVAGFLAETFTDPLFYIGGVGAIAKSAKTSGEGLRTILPKAMKVIDSKVTRKFNNVKRQYTRAGRSVRYAETKATKAASVLREELEAAHLARKAAAAKRAKPVQGWSTGFSRGKYMAAQAAAAQAQSMLKTSGKNTAAAAIMMLRAIERTPIAGELMRRLRTAIGKRAGQVVKRVRDTELPKSVSVLGKQISTGIQRKGTTVGQVFRKASKRINKHPNIVKGIATLKGIGKYANEAHLAGKQFVDVAGLSREERELSTNSTLTVNFYGGTRKATLNGKEYLVAPLSLIVEGVLNGSKGALHYPMAEMRKSCKAWENTPIVVYHPTDSFGRPQRAKNNASVLNRSGIGFVKNSEIRGNKLLAEGWFDLDRTKKIDIRVFNALTNGQKMELSTGLDTENIASFGTWNGRNYTSIARNYRPDHLAILPDQQGACSINDGCGLMVANSKKLTTNCSGKTGCNCGCTTQNKYVVNPFVSESQRRYMWAKHPEIARRWTDEMKSKGEKAVQQNKKKKVVNA